MTVWLNGEKCEEKKAHKEFSEFYSECHFVMFLSQRSDFEQKITNNQRDQIRPKKLLNREAKRLTVSRAHTN